MISIIIPVYNQYSSLVIVLKAFCMQSINIDKFEFVIVNDGSTDNIRDLSYIECVGNLKHKIIHQRNKGRAAARNAGIRESKGDIIIFCDADRFPNPDFIKQHLEFHQKKEADIVIGASYDYFGKKLCMDDDIHWSTIDRFSRAPLYFKKIASLYDAKGYTSSNISWLSFLAGNASIRRNIIEDIGGFDENFMEWGFEHFDLAYRLYSRADE